MLAPPNTRTPSPLGWKDEVDLRGGLEESLTALQPPHWKGQKGERGNGFPGEPSALSSSHVHRHGEESAILDTPGQGTRTEKEAPRAGGREHALS